MSAKIYRNIYMRAWDKVVAVAAAAACGAELDGGGVVGGGGTACLNVWSHGTRGEDVLFFLHPHGNLLAASCYVVRGTGRLGSICECGRNMARRVVPHLPRPRTERSS